MNNTALETRAGFYMDILLLGRSLEALLLGHRIKFKFSRNQQDVLIDKRQADSKIYIKGKIN